MLTTSEQYALKFRSLAVRLAEFGPPAAAAVGDAEQLAVALDVLRFLVPETISAYSEAASMARERDAALSQLAALQAPISA